MFENYGPQKWWIAKLPKHSTQAFSYKHIIQPAANYKRPFAFHTFRVVIAHLKRAYKYWFYRCRELVCADLWLPTAPDNNPTVIRRSVAHCLYCVPTHVVLHKNRIPLPVNPCSQFYICPFCASRLAEDLYRRLIRALAAVQNLKNNLSVFYRCERYFVRASDFDETGWTQPQFRAHITKLAKLLRAERLRYRKIAKELSTQTVGSLWTVVPYPADNGWFIEIRQFYITHSKSKRPANRKRNSSQLINMSINIHDTKQVINLLGEFVKYPNSMLTERVELTAVVLHARRGLRLLNGTGQLYRQGRESISKKEIKSAAPVP